MKTKLLLSALLTFSFLLSPCTAQVPQGFNYQAIARDGSGNPITGATIKVKLSVLSDTTGFYVSGSGTYIWEEEHLNVKTNAFGLFTIVLGDPSASQTAGSATSFSAINWTQSPLFIGTKIANPGTYKNMGSAKLWSVPYSMVSSNLSGPLTKLGVTGVSTSPDSVLFEVKNKSGQTVFAVYNEGVRIYVDEGVVKGATKGGFAIGSFGTDKAPSTSYFVVNADSIRAYITPNTGKGVKGGFAIGGFDPTKTYSGEEYLRVTRDSTRVYINDSDTKAAKGGFAIGGFGTDKGGNANFFNVETGSTGIINPSQNRVLWYPISNALLAGKVLIEKPDSVGVNSFATGYESKAIGQYSQALGFQAIARGEYTTSMGYQSLANKDNSFAFGQWAQACNQESYAFGKGAIAKGYRSFAFGSSAIDSAGKITGVTYAKGDYSFAVGQGSQSIGTGAFALGLADTARGDYSLAVGYKSMAGSYGALSMGSNTRASGILSTAMGYNTEASEWGSFAMGYNTTASGTSSTAIGVGTTASGYCSTALGEQTVASGLNSITMGHNTTANAIESTAMGEHTTASGDNSTAMGAETIASGNYSTAMGDGTTASGSVSIAMGSNSTASGFVSIALGNFASASGSGSAAIRNNATSSGFNSTALGTLTAAQSGYETAIGFGNKTYTPVSIAGWDPSDKLFVIGNGYNSPSNAMTILKNGNIAIGNITPLHLLDLSGGAYSDGSTWVNSSDRSLKENFEDVSGEQILGLINELPVTKWNYKTDNHAIKHIGPVAQDFYSLFGLGNDDKSISSIDPSGVALIAIKELSRQNKSMKEQIESTKQENQQLRSEVEELKTLVNTLVTNQTSKSSK